MSWLRNQRGTFHSLWALLLLSLLGSCSVPDGVMLSIRAPDGVRLQSYIIKIQDRSTRKVVFLSGVQSLSEKRLLATEPVRVALPFSQYGRCVSRSGSQAARRILRLLMWMAISFRMR